MACHDISWVFRFDEINCSQICKLGSYNMLQKVIAQVEWFEFTALLSSGGQFFYRHFKSGKGPLGYYHRPAALLLLVLKKWQNAIVRSHTLDFILNHPSGSKKCFGTIPRAKALGVVPRGWLNPESLVRLKTKLHNFYAQHTEKINLLSRPMWIDRVEWSSGENYVDNFEIQTVRALSKLCTTTRTLLFSVGAFAGFREPRFNYLCCNR